MNRYALVIIIMVLAFCLVFAAAFAAMNISMRRGLESLAAAVWQNDPEDVADLSALFVSMESTFENAKAGVDALSGSVYSTFSIDTFMSKLVPAEIAYWAIGAMAVIALAAAVFIIVEHGKRSSREASLTNRIGAALRGEEAFRAENEDERNIARLFAEIARLNSLRESSAEELREYVENVAHEIKSPTSGILLNLDLMERSGLNEGRLSAARKCATRIGSYVAGLLSLARMRAGKVRMSFEKLDLGELAREVAGELEANGIKTEISGEGGEINGDGVRISEALRNLIVNASKHREGEDPVRVELDNTEHAVALRVLDNGPGIKDETLIERYSVGTEDGTSFGIGLSLAREVAAMHSGRLVLNSPEKGASIELIIPRFNLKTSI
ncbi:MAG: HAMP domain-containing histidine kinase [Clostridia bacterium]|nr:HAMP domain-containing histidine kinase [Clostridia bacterium]